MNHKIKISRPLKLQAIKIKEKIEPNDQIFNQSEHFTESRPKQSQFLNQLSGMFAKFFKTIEKQKRSQTTYLEPRDRKIAIDVPQLQDGQTFSKDQLQQWISEVSRSIFSTAFNCYFKDQMTFEQTKIYCSENILRNIALLTDKINLSAEHMEIINSHLKNRILPYMNSKYPMTSQTDTNKAFQKTVKEVDNFDSTTYDFIFDTKVKFQYRESGNYNDLIMRFLNEIMMKMDSGSKFNPQFTNFKDFQNYMTQIFVKTEDQEWMNKKQGDESFKLQNVSFDTMKFIAQEIQKVKQTSEDNKKDFVALNKQYEEKTYEMKEKQRIKEIDKEKYRTKVREYTHFSINRKISQNTDIFSQNQIKALNFKIKSPAILRILTKWCQQLQFKYTHENYFTQMEQGVKIQKTGKSIGLFPWMKDSLKSRIKIQKEVIDNFLKQIKQNNYYYQSALFTKQVKQSNFLNQVDNIQKTCAKTSINIVDSLHSYIVQYLNRLIHGLLKIAKQFYDQQCNKSWENFKESPVNLLSFKIGDLMRCKCSSKQKQILKIFKEIQRLSDQQPNKIRIIRIKNRLKIGTNDILINVRFNNQINCQIQLAIHSSKSKFINCSSVFNHYLYELQRSMMGPITQICCVWNNLDPRFRIYNKMIKDQPIKKKSDPGCKQNQKHDLKICQKPFICNICSIAYSHHNFIKDHLKCSKCKFWTCAKCLLKQESPQKLISTFFKDQKTKRTCKRLNVQSNIPKFGACILIQTKKVKVQYFKYIQIKGRKRLFGIQNKNIYEIHQITSAKQKQQFFNNYIVYQLQQANPEMHFITEAKINCEIILPNYLTQCSKKQKQNLKLLQQRLQRNQWQTLFKFDQKNKFNQIKTIEMRSNYIHNINFIDQTDFPFLQDLKLQFNSFDEQQLIKLIRFKNLKRLNISNNQILKLLPEVSGFTNIQQIDLSQNGMGQISQEFCSLKNLSNVKMTQNNISKLPDRFGELQNLKCLIIQKNNISDISCIRNLNKIEILIANSNNISFLPEQVQWKKLKFLNLQKNGIKKISDHFFSMSSLQVLIIDQNQIESLPSTIENLKSLNELNISDNKISQIPKQIGQVTKLKIFKFQYNKIAYLPVQMEKIKVLQRVQASSNKLQYLAQPQIKPVNGEISHPIDLKMKSIVNLHLSYNELVKLPIFIQNLQSLVELKLDSNLMETIDGKILGKLLKLKILYLNNNKLKQLPMEIGNLYQLQTFDFTANLIQNIPACLSNLINIKELQFFLNPIKCKKSIQCYQFVYQKSGPKTKDMIIELPEQEIIIKGQTQTVENKPKQEQEQKQQIKQE